MKHLLSGVAVAAALAVAAPVWAQAPATSAPPAGAPPAAAPAAAAPAGAPMKPMAGKQRHKRMMRQHAAVHRRGMMKSGDAMTEQLNREELARIQGAPPPPPPTPQALQGPKAAGGGRGR